jgi:Helix-turn-helix
MVYGLATRLVPEHSPVGLGLPVQQPITRRPGAAACMNQCRMRRRRQASGPGNGSGLPAESFIRPLNSSPAVTSSPSGARNRIRSDPVPAIEMTKLKAMLLSLRDDHDQKIPAYEVAAACGIAPSTLSDYASGRTPFTRANLHALAHYFGVEPEELSGRISFDFPV